MTLGFIVGFAAGWIIRWKLDSIIDWFKSDDAPNYLRGKREE